MVMIKERHLAEHIIYGEWDDVQDNQYMLYEHPNGKHVVVFLFSGMDYGGGIDKVIETTTDVYNPIFEQYKDNIYMLKKKLGEIDA